ncbi:Uncharacterised protein [uncultured archaeon]|nr:Uncharacterised protein [uncultured archaeon]
MVDFGFGFKGVAVRLCFVVFVFSAVSCGVGASETSLGAGPSTVGFLRMVGGGYSEGVVTVSTAGAEWLNVSSHVDGAVKDWLVIEGVGVDGSFLLGPGGRTDLNVVVRLPDNVSVGNYSGTILLQGRPVNRVEGDITVGAGVVLSVVVEVVGDVVRSYSLGLVSVRDVESGSLVEFVVPVLNTGNVPVTPQVDVVVFDELGKDAVSVRSYGNTEVKASRTERIIVSIPSGDLSVGKYRADVSADGGQMQEIFFDVLDVGAFSLKGELNEVRSDRIWSSVGDRVRLAAFFRNNGVLPIEGAVFRGDAYLINEQDGSRVPAGKVESGVLNVSGGETAVLVSYFSPESVGRYIVRGRVFYGGAGTRSRDVILNVNGSAVTSGAVDKAANVSSGGNLTAAANAPDEVAGNGRLFYLVVGLVFVCGLFLIVAVMVLRLRGGGKG